MSNASLEQERLIALRNEIDEARDKLRIVETDLSSLNHTLKTFNITEVEADMYKVHSSLDKLESEFSDLVEKIGKLDQKTPASVYEATYKSVVVIRTSSGQGSGFLYGNQSLPATGGECPATAKNDRLESFTTLTAT